ncbi:uncharacterized protein LOC105095574 [Camelus dromedarius]|uniref:uncharacterized protein LOC116150778 n=1 Tax=Camelus dromedarius TaxID=9838 RepID=UPI001262D4E4|nr:uncharacterized protein LOC116150778 [Camelus dromedarius]
MKRKGLGWASRATQDSKAPREAEGLDHSLGHGHVSLRLLANELRAGAGGSGSLLTLPSSASHCQSARRFPALGTAATTGAGAVSPGRFSGCPGGFPVPGPPQAPSQTLVPCAAGFSAAPATSRRARCQQPPRNGGQPGGRHLRRSRRCSRVGVGRVPPAMSATEERGRIPGGRDTAGGWAGGDNRLLGVGVSPLEGMDGVQGVFRALPEDEGWQEEVAEAAVEENWAVELGEEEEDLEETEEEEEEGEGEEFEFEFEDQEEEEYQSEEGDEDEEEDEEEEEGETEEEEENGQEGTEVVSGAREAPTVRFGSLFRNLVHSVLPRVPSSDRDLVRPHAGRVVARRRSWQPLDLAEGPAPPQEVEARGEGPVPQEREDLGEEAEVWGGEALADASQSWEAGACGPEGRAQAGEWRPSPQALAAPVGASGPKAGGVQRLPLAVTQRVKALKNLQARHAQVEAQFYKDLFDLEKKYAAFYEPLFDRRAAIINAIHEPSEGECQWAVGVAEGAWEEMDAEPEGKGQINGIPHFWLTAFKNVKMLGRMIRGNDELALEHLTDVKIKFSGVEEPMSFTVEFIFESNEYFFNKVLTKTYRMRSDPDDSDPFFSRGPEIISSTGCEIYWKEGKDLTMKTLELQKCEGRGSVVPATGKVPSRSFFTYFYPPDSPEGRVLDIATDYKLGYFFREVLVPKSVLFFTKEATEYQCEDSDEEVQEAEGPRTEEPGRGPEKDVDPAEGSPGEASSQA